MLTVNDKNLKNHFMSSTTSVYVWEVKTKLEEVV